MPAHDRSTHANNAPGAATREASALPDAATALARSLTLRDGATLRLRAIHPDDAPRLQAFHQRLSPQAICFRFFGVMPELSSEFAERLSHVDYDERMAVVVMPSAEASAPIIAVARYVRTAPSEAEIALAVEDDWQGRGIGPQMLRVLAEYARSHGIALFIAEVLYTNERMLAMLRHARFPVTMRMREGRVVARLDIAG